MNKFPEPDFPCKWITPYSRLISISEKFDLQILNTTGSVELDKLSSMKTLSCLQECKSIIPIALAYIDTSEVLPIEFNHLKSRSWTQVVTSPIPFCFMIDSLKKISMTDPAFIKVFTPNEVSDVLGKFLFTEILDYCNRLQDFLISNSRLNLKFTVLNFGIDVHQQLRLTGSPGHPLCSSYEGI